jgi:hypothetical protein
LDILSTQNQMKAQFSAIAALVAGLTPEQARWKPNPESWSVLEVLNHLLDEEILDFRRHLDHLLHTPDAPWPEIDPQGWVVEKRYNDRDLNVTLAGFEKERERSIAWLSALENPNWESKATFTWGTLSAGDVLASWLAHDLLHIRQLVELRYALNQQASEPYHVDYAGKW